MFRELQLTWLRCALVLSLAVMGIWTAPPHVSAQGYDPSLTGCAGLDLCCMFCEQQVEFCDFFMLCHCVPIEGDRYPVTIHIVGRGTGYTCYKRCYGGPEYDPEQWKADCEADGGTSNENFIPVTATCEDIESFTMDPDTCYEESGLLYCGGEHITLPVEDPISLTIRGCKDVEFNLL